MKTLHSITAALALLLLAANPVLAQNTNETHTITKPATEGWDIPSSAQKDDNVNIKYTGDKYLKSVKVVPLPTTVTITPKCLTMIVGETATLAADIYPDITGVDKDVTWALTSGNAVTIDADGKVTAVSEGTATVTVTTNTNNKTDALVINVAAPSNTFVEKAFSVSSTKKVYFSKGNLQYNVNEQTWRFANHQWDYVGGSGSSAGNMGCNTNTSAAGPWIDLFGWGTWTKNGIAPNSTSTTNADYKTGVESSGDFENVCKEGIGSEWKTLSYSEWDYLRYTRTNASKLLGVATVNGVNGLILLPDEWSDPKPDGKEFKSGVASSYGVDYYKTVNEYTAAQWVQMESAGAVFLPAAGYRYGTSLYYVGDDGYCWSSSANDTNSARNLRFHSGYVGTSYYNRCGGRSVRLVRGL